MDTVWKILKIAGVYIGIIIGAGFASGREITSFFIVYGEKWIWGILLTGILFSYLGYFVLKIIYDEQVKSYHEFMRVILGRKAGKVMEWVSGIFLCVLFFTMVAAAGATGQEAFGIDYKTGVIFILGCCFLVFLADEKGVVLVSGILSPLMIFSGILVGLYLCFVQTSRVFLNDVPVYQENFQWVFSAILYVSYNIITAVTVLVSMNDMVTNKKIIRWSALLGGSCMGILGICIGAVMYLHYDEIRFLEIPMMKVIWDYGAMIKGLYLFLLVAAIFTTAVGNGYGAIKWLEEKWGGGGFMIKIIFIVMGGVFSVVGFSGFVERIYPLFGYLGLIEILFIGIYVVNRGKTSN